MEQAEYEKKYFPLCSQAGDLMLSGLSPGILVHDSPKQDQLGFSFRRGAGVWGSSSGFLSIWSLSDSYIRVPLLMKVSSGLLPSLSLVSLEHFPRLVAIASGKHIVPLPSLLLYPCKDPHI